ncbi:hypothetical protein FIBSPDRAFT_902909 [Athelia psychrophila]|uniref:Uncharacterized protein n=1 Tax=Athelia psychrophila TaxID=1759441 RepID=A0A167WMV4_9AGAM|nr:hypothetical protein FIBSPDRAFT_902909 [Fibularhizoctonia sp. CBS 109695]
MIWPPQLVLILKLCICTFLHLKVHNEVQALYIQDLENARTSTFANQYRKIVLPSNYYVACCTLGLFHRGEMQNKSHRKAYCKGCVDYHQLHASLVEVPEGLDAPERLQANQQRFSSGRTCQRREISPDFSLQTTLFGGLQAYFLIFRCALGGGGLVLLSLAGIYLHFCEHPIEEVQVGMMKCLEKRWKDCDQPLYLVALILNPFEGLSAFSDKAGMDHFKCNNLLLQLYRRIIDHPSNTDLPTERQAKECAISAAFFQYLASTGPFKAWKDQQESYEEFMEKDPILVWSALECHDDVAKLVRFTKMVLQFVLHQAGCERLFFRLAVR